MRVSFTIIVVFAGLLLASCDDDADKAAPAAATVSFTAPAVLAGLNLAEDPAQNQDATQRAQQITKQVAAPTSTLAATYLVKGKLIDTIEISAVAGTVADTAAAIKGLSEYAGALDDVAAVDPGPLGGAAQCGFTRSGLISATVCWWADPGSVGVLDIRSVDGTDKRGQFAALRGQVEYTSTAPSPAPSVAASPSAAADAH
jgi:hypothetical protein